MRKSKNEMYCYSFGKFHTSFSLWASSNTYRGIDDEELCFDKSNNPNKHINGFSYSNSIKLYEALKDERLFNSGFRIFWFNWFQKLWHLVFK